jgi:hypothetical protein
LILTVSVPVCVFTQRRFGTQHQRVCVALAINGALSAGEVSRETGIDRSDCAKVLSALRASGLTDGENAPLWGVGNFPLQPEVPVNKGEIGLAGVGVNSPYSENPSPLVPPSLPPAPPTHPPIIPPSLSVARRKPEGFRLPADWSLSAEDRAFAVERGVADPDELFAEFCDFWHSRAGPIARKTDWSKTWKNRVREVTKNVRLQNGSQARRSGPATGIAEGFARAISGLIAEGGGGDTSVALPLLEHERKRSAA